LSWLLLLLLHLVQRGGAWTGCEPAHTLLAVSTKCNSLPINSQCTNFISLDVAQ